MFSICNCHKFGALHFILFVAVVFLTSAELVMHSERITRHCKGINQALNDLKMRFNQMTQEQNHLADKFKQDIEGLETIFINATKSSK